jgi:tetratricopeptide (TPR) repeat protein
MRDRRSAPPVRKRSAGVGVTAVAAALLAALPYVFCGVSPNFIALDDSSYIYTNPQVRRGLTPRTALWALTSIEQSNWYPLRRLSHLVDVSLFGLDARGHHLVSVIWHAAAALLLFLALHRMTGRRWRSFVVAGLFAAHPLQVESVAWAAERSNVLAGFFFALTLLLWTRHARRPSWGRYGAVLCSCALGLMAKPVLMTLPLVLLLLDFWPLGRLSPPGAPPWRIPADLLGRRLLEKAPLLLLAAATGAVAVLAHRQADALSTLEAIPLGTRLGNAALSYWRYVGMMLWPADLAVFYPHPGKNLPFGAALAAGLLLAAVTVLVLRQARPRPWLAVGWLWYAGTLLPMSGIVQFGVHALADRFVYLPSIGVFLALVWLAAEGLPAPLRRPAVLGPAAAAALAALAAASAVQAGYWRDSETLFSRTLAVTSGNWMIHGNLGTVLVEQGRQEEAIAHYREALRLRPEFPSAHTNLGNAYLRLGRTQEALGHYREAVRLDPANALRHRNLGLALTRAGQGEEAAACYREAERLSGGGRQ